LLCDAAPAGCMMMSADCIAMSRLFTSRRAKWRVYDFVPFSKLLEQNKNQIRRIVEKRKLFFPSLVHSFVSLRRKSVMVYITQPRRLGNRTSE
jgi:hypothetical protein